jgi:hypothetical protein
MTSTNCSRSRHPVGRPTLRSAVGSPIGQSEHLLKSHLINLIKLRTSNHKLAIQQLRQVYRGPLYHGHPGHALFADLVMSRMSAT